MNAPTRTARQNPRPSGKAEAKAKPMLVAGVMSGTSADGVDVAICRVSPGTRTGGFPRVKVLAHRAFPYTGALRTAVLAAMDGRQTSTAELSRLSWRLGEVYARAVVDTVQRSGLQPQLIALHGQTVYHQAAAMPYLDAPVRCTWQIGEPSLLAEQIRLPVVSDFRTADMAAGGQGAPLVPMLDLCLFRHATKNRILLNLGGIANLTALPAGSGRDDVLAFDTGPANMVLDGCMERLTGKAYDCGGRVAGRGAVLEPVLREMLRHPFLEAAPPKSCGREQFGADFADRFLDRCAAEGARTADVLATATAFTAETIFDAYRRFVWPHLGQRAPLAQATEIYVSGGGARNATLLKRLGDGFAPLGVSVRSTEDTGLAVEAKEAAAFALLGWLAWHGLPGNVPAATGASRAVVLGRVTHV